MTYVRSFLKFLHKRTLDGVKFVLYVFRVVKLNASRKNRTELPHAKHTKIYGYKRLWIKIPCQKVSISSDPNNPGLRIAENLLLLTVFLQM